MPDQKTVKIPAQGAELESWLGLAGISDLVPQGWSLAGGSMMRLLACVSVGMRALSGNPRY